ncbi:hypothetical protein ACTXM8_10375 [Brachybacterium alimentarium]|uniref:hypothetical protein n=1 Tax=Brachybacterium alimentarium TaxID=47845 RepID=UPI003FD40A00
MKYNAFQNDVKMPSTARTMNSLTKRVQFIAKHGGDTPAAYTDALKRWKAWGELANTDPVKRLRDAYRAGADTDTLAVLHTAALAARAVSDRDKAEIRQAPEADALAALRTAYKPAAVKNYAAFRDQFNTAAAGLEDAADTVDIITDAEDLITADDTERQAWADAAQHADKLEQLVDVLAHTAALAGLTTHTDEAVFGLTAQVPDDVTRREAWDAWDSTGRCGRWGALIAAGVTITAPDLDDFTPYRKAKPLQRYYDKTTGKLTRTIDPEDTLTA